MTLVPAPRPVEVVREKEQTLATEGKASPRKPMVRTDSKSLAVRILLVAWLKTLSLASSSDMPEPLSLTTIRSRPPSAISTSMRVAPASRAFSESSFTTEAGRSTTSPAATCWATRGSSTATLAKKKRPPYIDYESDSTDLIVAAHGRLRTASLEDPKAGQRKRR